MSKICTSIEQSKKLLELGLSSDTADLYWEYNTLKFMDNDYDPNVVGCLAAWSLSALLELIPNWYMNSPNPMCSAYCCRSNDMETYEDDPLDAAFEMICWLLENKKI